MPLLKFSRAALAPLALIVAGCGVGAQEQAGGGGPGGGRAVEVGYVEVSAQSVPVTTELAGRTAAYQTSEVRPQISGIIRERLFEEGATVEAGETLYLVAPELYRAAASEAAANLAAAEANAEAVRARADRYAPLAEVEAVSQQDYADAVAEARKAEAAVAQMRAQLERARINLEYTEVAAPIGGRIGRSLFTVGALVTANQSDPLAVIQSLDPIFVDIQQSSADLLTLRRALASGGIVPSQAEVRLKLEDGSEYDHPGTVEFAEATVSESTGTVTLRARFPNPDGLLLPGMFVRAAFDQGAEEDAYLAPQVALTRDATGEAFVWIVGADDHAVQRRVQADRVYGEDWVVTSGLAEGDKVIVEGTGKLMPGITVRAVPAGAPERVGNPAAAGDEGQAIAAGSVSTEG